jgi:hypothetical protein
MCLLARSENDRETITVHFYYKASKFSDVARQAGAGTETNKLENVDNKHNFDQNKNTLTTPPHRKRAAMTYTSLMQHQHKITNEE